MPTDIYTIAAAAASRRLQEWSPVAWGQVQAGSYFKRPLDGFSLLLVVVVVFAATAAVAIDLCMALDS